MIFIKEILNNKSKHVKEMSIIVFAAVILGFLYNSFSEQKVPLIYKPFAPKSGSMLTVQEVNLIYKQKDALFIDARDKEEYEAGHIPGALNIPAGLGRTKKMALLNKLPKDIRIVVYCSNAACHKARRLAKEMLFLKFSSISVFEGGWETWEKNHGLQNGDRK
jgi:rhodanese-related sulfurtransferase